jgi:hypothetical protein
MAAKEDVCFVGVNYNGLLTFDNQSTHLPPSVMQWAGISSPSGIFVEDGYTKSLACENDSGVPFLEIARIIERHWAAL